MEWIYTFQPPISPSDIRKIEARLRSEDVFVPSFDSRHRSPYDLATYIEAQDVLHQPVTLFVDRNVVTRLIALLNGASASHAHRTAAAIMAFAQLTEISIEPSIAIHEYASSVGHDAAKCELDLFYEANNLDIQHWTDIALGRAAYAPDCRPPMEPRTITGRLDSTLYKWQRNYIALLKIGELHLAGGPSETRMAKFLEWSYDHFLLAGGATMFAAEYFAPGRPKRGLLKGIEADNREKAIEGIRNAAWDLVLVSDWFLSVRASNPERSNGSRSVLCTMDNAIKRFARMLVRFEDAGASEDESLRRLYIRTWGPDRGMRLAEQYLQYARTVDNPSRHFCRTKGLDFIPEYIAEGERAIRAWAP